MTAARARPADWRRQHHESVSSTNALALEAARNGDPGQLWITAAEQVAGRGRRGRPWVSARGNLHASLLLIDPAAAEIAASVSYVAGVALHEALSKLTGPRGAEVLKLKWPNDILCAGRKVAGILVEGERLSSGALAVVIGLGVNCVAHPDLGEAHPSGDLASLGLPVDAEPLFVALGEQMLTRLAEWRRGEAFGAIRLEWLRRAIGLGKEVRARLPDRVVDGRFEDIDGRGRLVVLRGDGVREAISAGDVFFSSGRMAGGKGGLSVGEPA